MTNLLFGKSSNKKFHQRSRMMVNKLKSKIKKYKKEKKSVKKLQINLKYHQKLLKSDIFFPAWAGSARYYKRSNAYNDRKKKKTSKI